MKIMHGFPGLSLVNGVNNSVRQLAEAQKGAGHEVIIATLDRSAADDPSGLYRVTSPWTLLHLLRGESPDVLHLHSVLRPILAQAALLAGREGIPVVASPRGGVSPLAISRRTGLKRLYEATVERRRLAEVDRFVVLTPREAADVLRIVPSASVDVVGNGVAALQPSSYRSRPCTGSHRHRCVYLGRGDVPHKGLDRIIELAQAVPEVDFELYGAQSEDVQRLFSAAALNNLFVHPPVHGDAKADLLTDACVYIQASRHEGFGRSIVEAMSVGLPVAVSSDCDLADLVAANHLGLVLDFRKADIDITFRNYLRSPEQRVHASRAQTWASNRSSPEAVARNVAIAYQRTEAGSRATRTPPKRRRP